MNEKIFRYLNSGFTEPIRDPVWKNIALSDSFMKIIQTGCFQKLGRIKQLGPAFHVYPGAVHTRLNHSLGVFHLARRLLLSLLSRGRPMDLTREGVDAFLTAALLHDIGHYPFAHSLKDLPLESHEVLTGRLIQEEPLRTIIRNTVGTDPSAAAAIVDDSLEADRETVFYRKLLSGVLDPDKLDYLNRDAFFCGVPYGTQDIDFILEKTIPHPEKGILLENRGIMAVENLLFSKYLMYRSVYWHRTVRIATAMIKHPVYMGMMENKIQPEELYGLDDDDFMKKFSGSDYPPLLLIGNVSSRKLFKSVMEIDFDESNPVHILLTDHAKRFAVSEKIAKDLSSGSSRTVRPEMVIIDIPEPISLEIDISLTDSDSADPPEISHFNTVHSVFSGDVVKGFTKALRKVRLLLPEEFSSLPDDPKSYFRP